MLSYYILHGGIFTSGFIYLFIYLGLTMTFFFDQNYFCPGYFFSFVLIAVIPNAGKSVQSPLSFFHTCNTQQSQGTLIPCEVRNCPNSEGSGVRTEGCGCGQDWREELRQGLSAHTTDVDVVGESGQVPLNYSLQFVILHSWIFNFSNFYQSHLLY